MKESFSKQANKYGSELGLSKSDIKEYISDSKLQFGSNVPVGTALREDLRMYKSTIPKSKKQRKRPVTKEEVEKARAEFTNTRSTSDFNKYQKLQDQFMIQMQSGKSRRRP